MSRRTAAPASGSAAGVKAVVGMSFVLVMAIVVLLLVRARPAPEPFDPRSGRPDGARGLVLMLDDVGADVTDTREVPNVGADTRVLLLEDRLDDEQRDRLLDFVDAGGVLVVADPESTLHGGSDIDGGSTPIGGRELTERRLDVEVEANIAPGSCNIESLAELRGLFVPDGILFPVGPSEPQCFTRDGNSFVIVRELGDGVIVGLGDNEVFVNRNLRRSDNAGLAASLLVPDRGAEVTFLIGRGASPTVADVGTGDDTLFDLVPTWIWMTLTLGAVAFLVFAISRSSRLGRIVSEPVAVPVAGSELVSATGNLMERAGHAQRAGWVTLNRLHRDLCRAHDVDLGAPLDMLDRAVAERSGTAPGEIERLFASSASDDASLVHIAQQVTRIRRTVLRPSEPSEQTTTPEHETTPERVSTS